MAQIPNGEAIEMIISGGAKGIDRCAARFARDYELPLIEILPDYNTYGRKAPLHRNLEIAQTADQCLAFGLAKGGTGHCLAQFRILKKPVQIVNPNQLQLFK